MTAQAVSSRSNDQLLGRKAFQVICVVLTATFVVYADLSVVSLAAPVIERQLRASVTDLELMVAGYQITYAAALVTGGRLADILGSALGAVISLSTVAGPLLGGLLIGANVFGLGWRPVFFINVPIGIAALAFGTRLIPAFRSQEAKRLDFTGTLLVATTLVAIMVPLTLGQLYGWPPWTWLCVAAAAVLVPLFLWSQRWSERNGRDPLLPSILWQDKAFRVGLLLYLILFSGVAAFFLYYSILVQSGYRITALTNAVTTIPFGIAAAALSSFSWPLVRRWGGRRVLAAGACIYGLGFASLLLPVTQVRGADLAVWTMPSQLVTGAGLALVIGGAVGVGLMGLLFQSQLAGGVASATASQLRSGMIYGLLYNPVTFGISALIVITSFRPRRRKPALTGAGAGVPDAETSVRRSGNSGSYQG